MFFYAHGGAHICVYIHLKPDMIISNERWINISFALLKEHGLMIYEFILKNEDFI